MTPLQRRLSAAQGYSELGMTADALDELDALSETEADQTEVLETRLTILMRASRWPDALRASRRLCEIVPEGNMGYIHAAFCLHELKETAAARAVLLAGPSGLAEEPTYHYNLACYECVLGNTEAARAHLASSVELDKKYLKYARTDPDLAPLMDQR